MQVSVFNASSGQMVLQIPSYEERPGVSSNERSMARAPASYMLDHWIRAPSICTALNPWMKLCEGPHLPRPAYSPHLQLAVGLKDTILSISLSTSGSTLACCFRSADPGTMGRGTGPKGLEMG